MKAALLLVVAGCGTTLHAKDYAADCDADSQCTVIVVGDICSCSCDLAAINDRDYDKYVNDVIRVGGCRDTCTSNDPDAAPVICGGGTGAQCSAGRCTTYALPTDAGAEM